MNDQLWSWLLTAVGLTCFWLAGRRVWWCWYFGLAGQVAWPAYSIAYTRNAIQWTRDRQPEEDDPMTEQEHPAVQHAAPLRPRCSAFRRHVRRTDDGEIITAVSCQWPVAHQGPHSFEQEGQ